MTDFSISPGVPVVDRHEHTTPPSDETRGRVQPDIPLPLALRYLLDEHNDNVERSFQRFKDANIELMNILGLKPEDGWKLDMDTLCYVYKPKE